MIEINIEKNELLVNPETGEVMRSYTMQRPHADKKSKEPLENFVVAPEGGIIVPTKWAKAYDKGDKTRRNSILRNLQNQESAKQMKAGGIVTGTDLGVNIGPSMENGQFVKNTGVKTPYTSTGSFVGAATAGLGAASNGGSVSQTANATIDGYLGSATPWYGLAKTGSDLTRGIVQSTSGNTDGGKFMDKALQPAHTNLLDNIDKGDWGGAVSSLFTGGVSDWIKAPNAKGPKNIQQEQQDLMLQTQANQNVVNTLSGMNINKQQDTMNPYKMKHGGRVPSYHSKLVPSYEGGTSYIDDLYNRSVHPQDFRFYNEPFVDNNFRVPSNTPQVPNTLTNNRPTTNTVLGGEDKGFNLNVDPNAIAAGAGVLGNSIGSIYDMIWSRGGKRYDKVNYGQVAPHLISNERALKEVDNSTAYGKENIRKLNPSGGGLLSAYTALAAKRAAAKAGILESTNNQNAGILNQNSQYNKGLEMQSMNDTAQNKARSEDIFRKGLRDTGTNVMYGIKDYQTSKTNNLYMRMLAAKYGNLPQYQSFLEEQGLNK